MMRTVFHAMRELLEPRLVQDGPLELCEDDAGSTCPPTILQRTGQSVALRFSPWEYTNGTTIPTNRWLFPIFDVRCSSPPICRSCDYILFYAPSTEPSRLFVFLCELKSGAEKGARTQIRNGKLIADYILAAMRLHGGITQWPAEILFRGLIFAGAARASKGTTRVPCGAEYIPDTTVPQLNVTTQRPGTSYPISMFCY